MYYDIIFACGNRFHGVSVCEGNKILNIFNKYNNYYYQLYLLVPGNPTIYILGYTYCTQIRYKSVLIFFTNNTREVRNYG